MNSGIILRIMRRAVSLPFENRELMLGAFTAVFLPSMILVLLHYLIATPYLVTVEDGYENSSLSHRDVISLVIIEVPLAASFCFVLFFSSAIAILASFSTHQGTPGRLKDILLSIKTSWKRILVSALYILLLMIGFLGFMIGLSLSLTRGSALVGIAAAVLAYPYLASLSILVLVISTLEYEYQGIRAFNQAQEIIRENKFSGYFLMLVLLLLSTPVNIMLYVTSTDDDDENGLVMQFGFLLISMILFCLMSFYCSIVYTLFYLDYKQRNSEKIEEPQVHTVITEIDL